MLQFMRKYSQGILIAIVAAFVGSIIIFGLSSSLYSLKSGKSAKRQSSARVYSEFASLGGEPLDYAKYGQLLYRSLSRFSKDDMDPAIIEYIKYNVFQEFSEFSLMLKEAENRKIKVSRKELKAQINKIMEAYKLKSQKELKEMLANNNLSYDYFKADIIASIKVSKLRNAAINGVSVSDVEFNNSFKEVKARHILIKIPEPKDSLDLEDQVNVSQVAREKAEEILAKAKAGDDFASLAKQYSEGPSAVNGGDLGWFGTGMMVGEFEEAAFSLAPGEITGPVKTMFGYHIVKVDDIRFKDRPEDKTDEELKKELLAKKREEAMSKILLPLRDTYKLEIFDPELLAYKNKMEGKFDEAIGQYQKLISRNPSTPILHIYIGQIYEMTGRLDEALTEYKKGVIKEELNSALKTPYLHMALGSTYAAMKKKREAIAEFEITSELAKDNLYLHEQLATKFKELKAWKQKRLEDAEIARIKRELEEKKKQLEEASATGNSTS